MLGQARNRLLESSDVSRNQGEVLQFDKLLVAFSKLFLGRRPESNSHVVPFRRGFIASPYNVHAVVILRDLVIPPPPRVRRSQFRATGGRERGGQADDGWWVEGKG